MTMKGLMRLLGSRGGPTMQHLKVEFATALGAMEAAPFRPV